METLTHDYHCPNCGAPMRDVSMRLYNVVETHYGCTVQILKNSVTGEISIGWWQDEYDETEGDIPL